LQPSIFDLSLTDIKTHLAEWGQPVYRAKQIWQGLYQQLWKSPNEFTSLPEDLRRRLADNFRFAALTPVEVLESRDHETIKTLFSLGDSRAVEAVLMKYDDRRTLCISTQAGCAMGCVFCATGQMGFKRNLSSGEIVEQVVYYERELRKIQEKVTNVVIMGMGEPFHNYDATMAAIKHLNDPDGLKMGERRFTISTVGLVPAIRRFTQEKTQINLAVSLHAANDELRNSLLPINLKYPIKDLLETCREYIEITRRRLTFEWALIQGVNDSPSDARQLSHLLHGMLCHVNIIPLNPTIRYVGHPTTRQNAEVFRNVLLDNGIPCTIRLRRGIDIQAGCGQLAVKASQE
jgi:23S rRNA (adenine2503-C2)-methyltransferase